MVKPIIKLEEIAEQMQEPKNLVLRNQLHRITAQMPSGDVARLIAFAEEMVKAKQERRNNQSRRHLKSVKPSEA
jgi:type VI protein secretion system component VasK